jgi:hypothetical protein
MFTDIKNDSTSIRTVFRPSCESSYKIRKKELEEKNGKPVAYISTDFGSKMKDVLRGDQYQMVAKRSDRCQQTETAVVADGPEIGQVRWICREKSCKDHLGRVRASIAAA